MYSQLILDKVLRVVLNVLTLNKEAVMEARREDLKPGMVVRYGISKAIVQRVLRNGVRIAYEGRGIRAGDYLHRTVSARDLEIK